MIGGKLIERIIGLIEDGYDTDENLETISFEYDIEIHRLKEIREQIHSKKENAKIEKNKQKVEYNIAPKIKHNEEKSNVNQNGIVIKKCTQIRENYYKVYHHTEKTTQKNPETTKNQYISAEVENAINDMIKFKENKATDIIPLLKNICKSLDKIQNEPISVGQAQKIISIIDELKTPSGYIYIIKKYKSSVTEKLVKALEEELKVVTDIERLKYLKSMLNSDEIKKYLISDSIKMKIDKRIEHIKSSQLKNNASEEISENMKKIISSIISDDCDVAELEGLIQKEIKTRVDKAPKTKFALSEKQHRTQIYYQLTKILDIHGDKYKIKEPKEKAEILEKLFRMGFDSNVRAVVRNSISQKKFKNAEELCDYFSSGLEEFSQSAVSISKLRDEIKRAEIGNIILKGIKSNATDEELLQFCKIIEERLNSQGSSLKLIPLGKSEDGLRIITLADVWDDLHKDRGNG